MINDIGEILKGLIDAEGLPYVETLAGVVQEETAEKPKGFTSKVFPVYCPQLEACDPNNIEPLVPDNKRKSLMYFERNGEILFRGRDKKYSQFTADLFFVAWLNPRKLGYTDCSISAKISAKIIQIWDKGYFNSGGTYSKILIKPISIAHKDKKIFDKYKYTDKFYHLLEYPYDYFRIRVQVDFMIHDNCLEDFNELPEILC